METIYLDHNSTTPPWPEVTQRVAEVMELSWGNPGSRHRIGRRARIVLEESREEIATLLEASPAEIVFTSGATESNNLALSSLASRLGTMITTPGDHPSLKEPLLNISGDGRPWHQLRVDSQGVLTDEDLALAPWKQASFASLLWAHPETGVIQPIDQVIKAAETYRVPVHLDAVQIAGRIPIRFASSGAISMSLGAHKFGGPRGIGALIVRSSYRIAPLIRGGHQESERRAGTECVALVAGMACAYRLSHASFERQKQVQLLRDQLQNLLKATCAPVEIHSERAFRLPNTLCVGFPGVSGEALMVALDLAGVACSMGSTCASGAAEPAPILLEMGCSRELARSSLRFSLGRTTTEAQIIEAAKRIEIEVSRLRGGQAT